LRAARFLVVTVICLVIMIYYGLQLPDIQTSLTTSATEWLSKKLGGSVNISSVKISWLDEVTFEDVSIKDLKGRDMIFVREIYVNCKTNFVFNMAELVDVDFKLSPFHFDVSFNPRKIIIFDDNLDYVMLKNPEVKLVKEKSGQLNFDDWINSINHLLQPDPSKSKPNHNKPFTIDDAYVQDGFVSLTDPRKARLPENQFDYFNFRIDGINASLENFFVLGDTITFNAKSLKGVERRSDLVIKDIKTDFFYCRSAMKLKNLEARINNSYIGDGINFYYERPSAFNDFNAKVKMQANLKDCSLDAQDLGRFSSTLYAYQEKYLLNGKVTGTVHDLTVHDLDLKFGKDSYLAGYVNFKGLPDLRKTKLDVNLKPSVFNAPDIKQYTSQKNYDNYVAKFEKTTFSGIFKGFYNDFTSDALVESTGLGKAKGVISMKIDEQSAKSTYFGDVVTTGLEIGKLTNIPDILQKISFAGKIEGRGLKISDATLGLKGKVEQIWFNGYDYKNIIVDGELGQSIFNGSIKVVDPNLLADVEGKVDFNEALNSFKIKGNLEKVNLGKLGFTETDYQLHTELDLDFEGNELDNWIGRGQFLNTYLTEKKNNLVIDSLFLTSVINGDSRKISVISEFLNGSITGSYVPSQLIRDLSQMVKEYRLYFSGNEADRKTYYEHKKAKTVLKPYDAGYQIRFKDSEPLFAFFNPEVYISNGSYLTGKVSIRSTSEFSMGGVLDTLKYGNNSFYANTIDFNSSKTSFSPEVLTSLVIDSKEQLLANELNTKDLAISGSWGKTNQISFDGSIEQKDTPNKAKIFGTVDFLPDSYDIRFNAKNSVLSVLNNKWTLSPNNLINIKGDDIFFKNIGLSNQNQSITLYGNISRDSTLQAILRVRDFDLNTIKPFTNVDLKGIANGEVNLSNYYKSPIITSDLHIDELIYRKSLIGTIAAEAVWDNINNKLNINGNIYRINSEIFRLSGTYDPRSAANSLNLNANIRNANLEISQAFVDGLFSNIGGFANGNLTVKGTPLNPVIRGSVALDRGSLRINAINSYLYFDDTILFNEEGFVAPPGGITVRDAPQNGNTATIEGGIFNGGNRNFMLGLHAYLKGRDGFRIMNTKSSDNESFYGTALATGELHMTGDFNNVVISSNLTSKRGTKITIPLDGETTINTNVEAIPFIRKNPVLAKTDSVTNLKKNPKKVVKNSGLKMAFNLTLTPDAECEIIFDRNNNDKLTAFGNGRISIEYDTRGGFSINGPYIVKSGKYDFSFQNLASLRKFEIVDGSRITWSGDPLEAMLDMKASYTANVTLSDIPGIQAATNNQSDLSTRYPVNVMVNLTDRLLIPKITYSLSFDTRQIPLSYQTYLLAFEQKLKDDEQLLSRNVSSILAFNQIFPENNILESLRQQFFIDNLNNILSNQIGNLANKLDPNLELGVQFGDFRENLLKNMQLNFSYKFLNNRFKFSGKSTFMSPLESGISTTTNQQQLSVGGELEYLLSEDGTFRLRGYSRSVPNSNYFLFNSTSGNVVVSGVSLIFSRNFNSILSSPKSKTFPLGVGTQKPLPKEVSFNNSRADSIRSTNK
jgi:hypothetical protein